MGRPRAWVTAMVVLLTAMAAAPRASEPPFVTVYFRCATPPNIIDSSSKVVEELRRLVTERGIFRNAMTVAENENAADIVVDVVVSDKTSDGPGDKELAETKATLRFGNYYRTEMLAHSNIMAPEACAEPLALRIRQWVKDNETQVLAARPR